MVDDVGQHVEGAGQEGAGGGRLVLVADALGPGEAGARPRRSGGTACSRRRRRRGSRGGRRSPGPSRARECSRFIQGGSCRPSLSQRTIDPVDEVGARRRPACDRARPAPLRGRTSSESRKPRNSPVACAAPTLRAEPSPPLGDVHDRDAADRAPRSASAISPDRSGEPSSTTIASPALPVLGEQRVEAGRKVGLDVVGGDHDRDRRSAPTARQLHASAGSRLPAVSDRDERGTSQRLSSPQVP